MRAIRALLLMLLFAWAVPAAAQEADVLTGRITGVDGKPLAGARVEAMSIETEITRSVITDDNGRYTILFPDGGGAYLLRVSYLGMAPAVKTLVREGAEELLLLNITLEPQAITLERIEVTGQRPPPGQGDSGEQSTELTADMLNRLPLPDLDPNTLALLAAGVTGTEVDSLTGRLGFSVAGMSDLLNQITIDGMIVGEGGLNVPEEGLRQTRVTTSTFDVSRGGFAGGQVSMTTARGNNRSAGSLRYQFQGDALQFQSTPSSNAFTNHNLSGSWGGPLIRNGLFYNVSFGVSNNTQHLFALSADDPLAAERSGVAVDSISRFMNILGGSYGLPTGSGGAYDNANKNYTFQGRFDWNVFQRQGQSQTLQLTVRKGINAQDSTRIRPTELTQHAGETERDNHSVGLNLTSRFGRSWTNGLRFSYSENWNESQPFFEIPEGVVRVTSDFEDGTRQTSSITFGGNRSMPQESYARNMQLSEDLSFLLPVGDGLHRLKVGGSVEKSRNINRSTSNIFGSFTFNSIEDFENNLPSSFSRALTERNERSGTFNAGVYVGDTWRVSNPLEITLGLRWDYTKLDQRPEYNPAIEEAFGRRTDIEPVSTSFSPRVGFNYRLNQQGRPARSVSGGLGLFAGRAPTNIFSAATRQTGLPNAEQSLRCIGEVVPIPDWDLYLQDPDAIPTTCADGGPGVPDAFSSRAPNVTLIDPDQSSPSSLRADVGYRMQLPLRLNGNFRYQYSRGLGLWGYRDINLDETNTFTLAGENRPFFGDPSAIVESTGAVSMTKSRIDEDFGNVYDVISDRESATHQVTAQMSGYVFTRLMFNANYTLGFSRDQGSQSFAGATTADNPNKVEWGTASSDRRHTLNLTLSYPITPEIEITALGRLSSGSPFTPMVNRDINGDGSRNDRAFIPDPATADPETTAAMHRLLDNVPGRVRDCIESQLGRIADRNSCRNGWSQGLDMRLGLRPNLPTLGRRLTVSVNATNVLTGLDQLVNGRDDMKGWGNSRGADSNLLEVDGFDPVRSAFIYEVNEGFGQVRRGSTSFGRGGSVFGLRVEGRLAVGGNPGQSNRGFGPLAGGFGGRGGRGGGGDFGGGFGGRGGAGGLGAFASVISADGAMNVDSVLASMLPNPVASVLTMKDTLGLTPTQVEIVTIISDTLAARLARRRAAVALVAQEILPALQEALTNAPAQPAGGGRGRGGRGGGNPFGGNAELSQRYQLDIQPHIEGGQRETREALGLVQREVSPEQWSMIPETVRNAGQVQGGGGRGNFNAVAVIDRMLVNPIPVLIELKETLKFTPDQVAQLEAISAGLQNKLNERRAQLGQRFDNVSAQQQFQIYQEIQPQIDEARREITEALRAAEKVLTDDQWKQVPEQVRNPFQNQAGPGGGGRGRRGGGGGDSQ